MQLNIIVYCDAEKTPLVLPIMSCPGSLAELRQILEQRTKRHAKLISYWNYSTSRYDLLENVQQLRQTDALLASASPAATTSMLPTSLSTYRAQLWAESALLVLVPLDPEKDRAEFLELSNHVQRMMGNRYIAFDLQQATRVQYPYLTRMFDQTRQEGGILHGDHDKVRLLYYTNNSWSTTEVLQYGFVLRDGIPVRSEEAALCTNAIGSMRKDIHNTMKSLSIPEIGTNGRNSCASTRQNPFIFASSMLNADDKKAAMEARQKVLLCEVAPGRSWFSDVPLTNSGAPVTPPDGYDSLYYSEDTNLRDQRPKAMQWTRQLPYVTQVRVHVSHQALPRYVLTVFPRKRDEPSGVSGAGGEGGLSPSSPSPSTSPSWVGAGASTIPPLLPASSTEAFPAAEVYSILSPQSREHELDASVGSLYSSTLGNGRRRRSHSVAAAAPIAGESIRPSVAPARPSSADAALLRDDNHSHRGAPNMHVSYAEGPLLLASSPAPSPRSVSASRMHPRREQQQRQMSPRRREDSLDSSSPQGSLSRRPGMQQSTTDLPSSQYRYDPSGSGAASPPRFSAREPTAEGGPGRYSPPPNPRRQISSNDNGLSMNTGAPLSGYALHSPSRGAAVSGKLPASSSLMRSAYSGDASRPLPPGASMPPALESSPSHERPLRSLAGGGAAASGPRFNPIQCPVHPQQLTALHCILCDELICPYCASVGTHRGHEVEEAQVHAARVRRQMQALCHDLNQWRDHFARVEAQLAAEQTEMQRRHRHRVLQLRGQFAELRKALDARERSLFRQLTEQSGLLTPPVREASEVRAKYQRALAPLEHALASLRAPPQSAGNQRQVAAPTQPPLGALLQFSRLGPRLMCDAQNSFKLADKAEETRLASAVDMVRGANKRVDVMLGAINVDLIRRQIEALGDGTDSDKRSSAVAPGVASPVATDAVNSHILHINTGTEGIRRTTSSPPSSSRYDRWSTNVSPIRSPSGVVSRQSVSFSEADDAQQPQPSQNRDRHTGRDTSSVSTGRRCRSPGGGTYRASPLMERCLLDLQRGHIWSIQDATQLFCPGQTMAVCSTPFRLLGVQWELRIAPLPASSDAALSFSFAADGRGRGGGGLAALSTAPAYGCTDGSAPNPYEIDFGAASARASDGVRTPPPLLIDPPSSRPDLRQPPSQYNEPSHLAGGLVGRHKSTGTNFGRASSPFEDASITNAAGEEQWLGLFLFPCGHRMRFDFRVIAFSEVSWTEWKVNGWTESFSGKGWGVFPFLRRKDLMRTDKLARDNIVKICVAPISDLY